MNGSGRSSAALSLDAAKAVATPAGRLPDRHPYTITVPGAAAAWCDSIATWGTMSLDAVLAPAIKLAKGVCMWCVRVCLCVSVFSRSVSRFWCSL